MGSIRGSLEGRSSFSSTSTSFTMFSLPLFLINQEAKAIDRSITANETRAQIGDGCLRHRLSIFVKLQATSLEIIRSGDKRLINPRCFIPVLLLNGFLFTCVIDENSCEIKRSCHKNGSTLNENAN